MKRLLSTLSGLLIMASLVLTGCPQDPPPDVEYEVTFDLGYEGATGAPETQTVASGETATAPAAPTRDHYNFNGWYLGNASYDFSTAVTASITLVAQWTIDQHTITFDANGASGTAPAAQTVDYGTALTLPGVGDMTYDGKTFVGWATTDTSTSVLSSYTVEDDDTLYAIWSDAPVFVITFDLNYTGAPAAATSTVIEGNSVSEPADPTRTGYTFDGWYEEAACTTAYDFETAVNAADTLYAKWVANPVVTFDLNYSGAPASETETVSPGTAVSEPVDPTRTGYAFDGWYNEAECTTAYDFATLVSADDTLYAKWTLVGSSANPAAMPSDATTYIAQKAEGNNNLSVYFSFDTPVTVGDRIKVSFNITGANNFKQVAAVGDWVANAWSGSVWVGDAGIPDAYAFSTTVTATEALATGGAFHVYLDNIISGDFPASLEITLSNMTIVNRGPAPSFAGPSFDMEELSTTEEFGSLGWSALVTKVVSIADVSGLAADAGHTKALSFAGNNYNAGMLITNVSIPQALDNYTSVTIRAYLPRATVATASGDQYYYKDFNLHIAASLSGATGSGNAAGYMGKVSTGGNMDSWYDFTITLDATAKAALAETTGLQLGFGPSGPDATSFAPFFVDQITFNE